MIIYLGMIDTLEDKSKFEQIYLQYRYLMYHVAFSVLHNGPDAEDAVHQAFVKIAENIKRIEEPVCQRTKSYVVTIAENTAIDIYRRNKKHPSVDFEEAFMGESITYDGDNALVSCILKLPQRYRGMLILRYRHGYSVREISKIMGISLDAATKLDQRAKSKLKTLCEEVGIL